RAGAERGIVLGTGAAGPALTRRDRVPERAGVRPANRGPDRDGEVARREREVVAGPDLAGRGERRRHLLGGLVCGARGEDGNDKDTKVRDGFHARLERPRRIRVSTPR